MEETQPSGTVAKLWRYPVKSMLGESCQSLDLDARGVAGDRLFAIRDVNGKFGSGKTTRRFARIDGLFAFRSFYEGDVPQIEFPDGSRRSGDDPRVHEALSAALGQPVTLAREATISHLDTGPVHLVTTASLAWLSTALPASQVDERRFRPNLLIDVPGETLVEQSWMGRTLCIGPQVRLRVHKTTERCVMITHAQSDLPSDPGILRQVAREADSNFGVYAEVIVPGRISTGDSVTLRMED
jgi:uncharacterized protein YcbX